MKRILYLALALCLASGFAGVLAQEPTIRIALETDHIIFGLPVWATYTVTNSTEVPLFVSGTPQSDASFFLWRWSALAYGPADNLVPIHKDFERYAGEDNPRPKIMLGPGKSTTLKQPVPVTDVTISELPPGQYKLVFSLSYSLTDTPNVWEKEATATTLFRIDAPEDADAAYVKALQQTIRTCETSDLLRPTRESPLRWREILEPPVKGFQAKLLSSYPTSNYAGYALQQRVPSPAQQALTCLNNPDETLRAWGDRGGGEENTQRHIAEAQREMTAYAAAASAFLRAHPNSIYAPGIQRGYAMCLGLTGHTPAAIVEVQRLSSGSGKEAIEARSFLDEKNSSKTK